MFSKNFEDDDAMAIKEGPQYLLFYLQSHLFAFKASHISEIVELPQITKVPWMKPSIRGICNIRGSIIGVLDIAKYLMDTDCMITEKSSLVIVNIEFEDSIHKIALMVDEVYEVEVFESEMLGNVPSFGLPIDSQYVASMVLYQNDFIPVLALETIIDIELLSRREE